MTYGTATVPGPALDYSNLSDFFSQVIALRLTLLFQTKTISAVPALGLTVMFLHIHPQFSLLLAVSESAESGVVAFVFL